MISALSLNAVSSDATGEERNLAQTREHRRNPPALQAPVDHERREEEADEQRRLEVFERRIGGGGAIETEEEQEAADEERPDDGR